MSKPSQSTPEQLEAQLAIVEAELAEAKMLAARYESANNHRNELLQERSSFASKLYDHGLAIHPDGTIIPIWMPTDDVVIRFDDKTGEPRSEAELDDMVGAMRVVANNYNFDLQQWGSGESFLKFASLQLKLQGEIDGQT